MKLTAMVMVGPGEADRYLTPFLDHLREFCDEVRIRHECGVAPCRDNLHDDSTLKILHGPPTFFAHEGRARNELLDWALEGRPSHLLAIDSDELVTNGKAVRRACEGPGEVLMLEMQEVWCAEAGCLCVRMDGGWRARRIGPVFRVPKVRNQLFRIADRPAACGREPVAVAQQVMRRRGLVNVDAEILHLGWANEADRVARHARYADADSFGHNPRHIDSIMWADDQVKLEWRTWPAALKPVKAAVLERINRKAVAA